MKSSNNKNDIRVAVIQTDIKWGDKEYNMAYCESQIAKLNNVDIVVLPEMFTTGFMVDYIEYAEKSNGKVLNWIDFITDRYKIALACGVMVSEGQQIYNRFYWKAPDEDLQWYDKRHLFAYGGEDKMFSRGSLRKVFNFKGWKILPFICYDLRFPVWLRNGFVNGKFDYDLMICIANWPEVRTNAWKTLLAARAIENQCWVVAANRVGIDGMDIKYSGDSAIINPYGDTLQTLHNSEGVIIDELSMEMLDTFRKKFPVSNDWEVSFTNSNNKNVGNICLIINLR